jgi:hypothetical protein
MTNHAPIEPTIENLSKAIFIVNKHAKTAPNPKFLYELKKTALTKMIQLGQATKVGLHFSRNPKLSQQRSDVVVQCGEYAFHIPPTKEDFQTLPHLGALDNQTRNPKTHLPLQQAKSLLMAYTGVKETDIQTTANSQRTSYSQIRPTTYQKPVFKRLGER